jgi:hypothetical protein
MPKVAERLLWAFLFCAIKYGESLKNIWKCGAGLYFCEGMAGTVLVEIIKASASKADINAIDLRFILTLRRINESELRLYRC